MPRPQRALDPHQGPVQAFAAALRALRAEAGDPKFASMSRRSGRSKTALSEAVGGGHLPRWETVSGFVDACGGRPEDWRALWEEARDAAATTEDTPRPTSDAPEARAPAESAPEESEPEGIQPAAPEPAAPQPAATAPASAHRVGRRRVRAGAALVGAALVGAALVGAAVTLGVVVLTGDGEPAVPVVVVQNKVAVGPTALLEDATPAYLSTIPAPYCKARGCGVPGTDMASGAVLAVDCTVSAEDMVNYEADSVLSQDNPHRVQSTLWYRARFPDGRGGFVSEVYVDPASRGGLGLPDCADGGPRALGPSPAG
jgi:hypothetical protein